MKFIVKSPIHHDGEAYEVGEEIDLSEKQAALLPDAVASAKKAKEDKESQAGS